MFDQLNVYENIVFNMPENTRGLEEKADALMQKLDIAQCKKKKINELSGGQQQRVSIVRALIKDCKILLADEPTGNLDEENGRLIFDALKDISKDRLMIVVSHDRDSAYAYGDMVIEMNDGVAKQTHCLTQVAEGKTQLKPDMEKKRQHSSLKTTLKLSVNFMIKKKLRMVFSMLLLVISLGIMGVTSMFYQYDFGAISASVLIDQTDDYLSVVKGFRDPETDKYNMTDMFCRVDEEFIDDMAQKHSLTSVDKNYQLFGMTISRGSGNDFYRNSVDHAVVSSQNDLEKYGFELTYGKYPQGTTQVALTDYLANSIALQDPTYIVRRLGVVNFDELRSDNDALIAALRNLDGATLAELFGADWEDKISAQETLDNLRNNFGLLLLNDEIVLGSNTYKVTGIIRTDYMEDYGDILSGESTDEVKTQELSLKSLHLFNSLFVDEEWIEDPYNGSSIDVKGVKSTAFSAADNEFGALAEDEIYLSRSLFRNIFGQEFDPQQAGEYLYKNSLTFRSANGNYSYDAFAGDVLKVVGVFDSADSSYEVIYSDAYFEKYKKQISFCCGFTFQLERDAGALTDIVNDLYASDMSYSTANSYYMYNLADMLEIFKTVFLIIGAILGVFSMIMVYNYFSIIIQSQKREIGIMRALGMSRKQISVIYLMCGIILICVTIILAWAILGIMGVICNDILVEQYIWYTNASTLSNLTILTFGWLPFVLIGVFGIAIAVISTLLPIWKIGRMKPIDAIKNE